LDLRILVDFLYDLWVDYVFPFDVFHKDSWLVCKKSPKELVYIEVVWIDLVFFFTIVIDKVGTSEKFLVHIRSREHKDRCSDEIIKRGDESWIRG
jgi:hypothetical protein